MPEPVTDNTPAWSKPSTEDDRLSIPSSSRSGSASEVEGTSRNGSRQQRPKLHSRKSSGTIIVPAASSQIEVDDEEYDEGDARTMSPRRSSEEVDRLEEGLRQNMIEQSKQLQASLLNLVDRVESVKAEHEKLEGGNRFLQSYVGILCDWCARSRLPALPRAKASKEPSNHRSRLSLDQVVPSIKLQAA